MRTQNRIAIPVSACVTEHGLVHVTAELDAHHPQILTGSSGGGTASAMARRDYQPAYDIVKLGCIVEMMWWCGTHAPHFGEYCDPTMI